MRVLLLGARGFIGRHIAQALLAQGHHVVTPSGPEGAAFNMAELTTPAAWLPHLQMQHGLVEAVINAVGVLRGRADRPMHSVHTLAPSALFAACAEQGIRRVIQISALGIDGIDTSYACTKRAADAALLALQAQGRLEGVVLRPSIVIGEGGASTALFQALARWPVVVWPRRATVCQVQPLAVQDLAWGCVRLLSEHRHFNGVLAAVGEEQASVAQWVARLRAQCGHRPATVCTLPDALAAMSAWFGDLVPLMPWGRATWALLSRDNVADPRAWQAVLGRTPSAVWAFMNDGRMPHTVTHTSEV